MTERTAQQRHDDIAAAVATIITLWAPLRPGARYPEHIGANPSATLIKIRQYVPATEHTIRFKSGAITTLAHPDDAPQVVALVSRALRVPSYDRLEWKLQRAVTDPEWSTLS
jgi:hypothetical protein